jgi:hypothetical protein
VVALIVQSKSLMTGTYQMDNGILRSLKADVLNTSNESYNKIDYMYMPEQKFSLSVTQPDTL